MTINPANLAAIPDPANNSTSEANLEWQLAEFVDAIAAEIDHAEDTLSLKSYARGMSFAIKQLNLDLEVTVRRAPDGRILFKTVEPNQTSATVLKLDFAQVIQSQLQGIRKPLDRPADHRPLAKLTDISDADIKALHAIAIYSIDDLERYTQTAAMIAEVSRKTGIEDYRIRKWRQLPFIEVLKPARGLPGSTILIEGSNFGTQPDPNTVILFQGQPATIISWSESRLQIKMPQVSGSGALFAVINGQMTNTVSWEATAVDLFVRDITINPSAPLAGDTIVITADLINQGGSASGGFEVQWTIDNQPQNRQPHGTLQPGQRSQESSTSLRLNNLSPGKHTIRFTADPNKQLPDVNPANSTFAKEIVVGALKQLTIADFRSTETLDPLRNASQGPADVLSLVFRGLVRRDPTTGIILPDLAKSWNIQTLDDSIMVSLRPMPRPDDEDRLPIPQPIQWQQIVTFYLRDDVRFHNGLPVTAEDVAFSYQMDRRGASVWGSGTPRITGIEVNDPKTITFYLQQRTTFQSLPAQLWMLGIVPRRVYEADANNFALKPIGSGPFQVETFVPGKNINLIAFREYMQGTPRLDRLQISTISDVNQLSDKVLTNSVGAAVLPYSEQLYNQFKSRPNFTVVTALNSSPPLLHIQPSPGINERQPNAFDTNWNAHLWYR